MAGLCRGVQGGPPEARLDRRPQCPDRAALGRCRCRSQAGLRGRAGEFETGRHHRGWLIIPDVAFANDPNHTDRVRTGQRSGSRRLRREPGAPGGNITGFALYEYAIAAKWLELIKQIAPRVTHVGVIHDPTLTVNDGQLPEIVSAAPSFGVQLSTFAVRNAAEIERAIEEFGPVPDGGLVVLPNSPTVTHRGLIVALAAKHRMPAVYPYRMYVASGGLASYGVDVADLYRRAASYVDRIHRGERRGEPPVQYATKYELVTTLTPAKALGLAPPISLLARTDEVIE